MLQQFTHAELQSFNRPQLWQLCRERGLKCYPKTADCVEAIWSKQQSVEKVQVAEVAEPEQEVASVTTVEITFYDHEIYALGKQIAAITYDMDDFQTQRWMVIVGKTEVHRADSWAKCHSYITWHYKQGTLPTTLPVAAESKVVGGEFHHLEMEVKKIVEFIPTPILTATLIGFTAPCKVFHSGYLSRRR